MNLVSIVIPVSGTEFFEEALKSICDQTYRNLEIIIIDSSEENEKILNMISSRRDRRIRYFYQKRSGIANALNFGIEKATGTYLARMDADDVAFPNRIAVQAAFMDTHPEIDVVASSCMIINEKGVCVREEHRPCSCDEIPYQLLFDNPISHPTVMFRSALFVQGWRYQNVASEDYDLWVRLAVSHKIEVLPDILLKYRVHEKNLSSMNALKVSDSDTGSALNYINTLWALNLPADKKWLLTKNYHLPYMATEGMGEDSDFLILHYDLLRRLYRVATSFEEKRSDVINKIVLCRWKKILDVSELMYPREELSQFPLEERDADPFRRHLVDEVKKNTSLIKKMKKERIRFILYGFGERGHRTLECYQKLHREKLNNWELLGIIDKERKSYLAKGNIRKTCVKEELKKYEFDYILISSLEFYEEIREELGTLGIPEEKVIRDNIIYYF